MEWIHTFTNIQPHQGIYLFIFLSNGSGVWGWAGLVGWAGGDAGPSSRSGHDSKARCVENFFCFVLFFGGTAVFGACMLIFQLRRLPLDWYENLLAFSCFIPIGPHNSGWLYLENEINVCFINCAHTYLSKQTTAGCVCVCTTDILEFPVSQLCGDIQQDIMVTRAKIWL